MKLPWTLLAALAIPACHPQAAPSAVTDQALLALAEDFFTKGFDFTRAQSRLGNAASPASGRLVPLRPIASNVAAAELEVAERRAPGEPAVEGIVLGIEPPVLVDRDAWAAAFGSPVDTPRLHPGQDVRARYLVRGRELEGYVLLGRDPGANERGTTPVRSLILRRSLAD